MESLLILAIGIVLGWNLPQPDWARHLQDKFTTWVRGLFAGRP